MEFQFIYSTKSVTLRYFPSTTSQDTLYTVIEILTKRFLLYFQGSVIQLKVFSIKDGDGIEMSINNIISNGVTPVFVYVSDGTQNMKSAISPTREILSLPLTKSNSYTVNPNGFLTEYLGKHPNIGKDNKAPFLVSAEAGSLKKPTAPAGLTLDDLKPHNRKNDCWIAIEGKVFDITKYIQYHPGGDIILDAAGKDGTSLYHHYHPWVNVQALIGKFQVGFLKR